MEYKNVGDIEEKFFFDMHHFDDEEIEDEDAPPPPPVFSEEELEAAKKSAFAEGHSQATREQIDGQNQAIANTLAVITKDISSLFAAEQERTKTYEQEAVSSTTHVFETLFPLYSARQGFSELRKTLSDILEKQRATRTINIFVAPDMQGGVEEHIQTISTQYADMHCDVIADEQLVGHACRLSWKDGGALYDPSALADEVLRILKQTLADDGFTGHDKASGEDDAQVSPSVQDDSGDDAPDVMEKPNE